MPRYAQSRDLLESLRRFRDIIGNIQRSVDVLATIIEQTEDDMEPTLQGGAFVSGETAHTRLTRLDAQLDVVEQDWASSDIVAYWFGPSEGGGGRIGVPEGVAQAQSGERSGITLSVPEHDLALRDVTSPHTSMDTSNSPRARIARNPTLAEAAHPLRQGTAGDPKLRLGYDYVDSYRERADDGWEIANRLDGLGGCLR